MKSDNKGFGVVGILIIFIIVGLVGAVGWLVYDRQKSRTGNIPTTPQISQQNQKQEIQKEETKKADLNEGYLIVKEWGLRFKIPSGLTDVKYTIHGDTASFFAKPTGSSVQYRTDYDKYEDGRSQYAIGNLYRSTSSTKPFAGNETREGKKVGDYYYYTSWAFSSLATGAACVETYGDSSESNCASEGSAFALVNGNDGNKAALLLTIELAQ